MRNYKSSFTGLIILISLTFSLYAANYEPIPVFTNEFIRKKEFTRIPLHVDTADKAYPDMWSVRGGIPFPKDELPNIKMVQVLDSKMKPVPCQLRPLAWWAEKKSIKWLEVEFNIRKGEINPTYYLEFGPEILAKKYKPLNIKETEDAFIIDTGKLQATVSKKHGSILEKIQVKNQNGNWDALKNPISSFIELRDIEGDRSGSYDSLLDKNPGIKIERHGAESVTLLIKAYHKKADGKQTFPTDTRLTFFRDQPRIKIFHTFYVSENPAITFFPTLGINIPLTICKKMTLGVDKTSVPLPAPPFSMWQDSSEVPVYPKCNQFAPFCNVYKGNSRKEEILYKGKKADGWIKAEDQNKAVTVTLRRMWQEFPKGFKMGNDGDLKIEYWPKIKPNPMDLRRIDQKFPEDYQFFKVGEGPRIRGYEYNMKVYHRSMFKEQELYCSAFNKAKSHEIWLDFSEPAIPANKLAEAADRPLLPFVTPAWNRFTNALGVFHPEDLKNFPKVERGWELYWDTLMKHQTEWFNWYGMWNWGDFQTDYFTDQTRWGHYNTKYGWRNGGMDIPYSIFLWYLRSGKRKYFDLAEITSLHLMDVDSSHIRAWEDERLFPKGWKGAGTSRYDKNHWGAPAGIDPQHCFSHSIQMLWLVTGNSYVRDYIFDFATNYYNREKAFNYKRHLGKDLHYHGRVCDMPSRLAGNAYENDPLDPRWQEMLDFFLETQAEGFRSTYIDKKTGKARRKCNNLEILTFYYGLYHVAAINYLLTLKDCPELVEACKQGIPKRCVESGGEGLMYYFLYLFKGNRNYAKFAGRQAVTHGSFLLRPNQKPDKGTKLRPHIMGGIWSLYPGLLEAVVKTDQELSPENYDDRELNYYPIGQPGPDNRKSSNTLIYEPLDIRTVCNWAAGNDSGKPGQGITANDDPEKKCVTFDFGPIGKVATGAIPITGKTYYPSTIAVKQGFSALPFGAYALFNNVLFGLLPYSTQLGKNMLVVEESGSYTIPVNKSAKKIYLLTGVSLAEDKFHEGTGATVTINYAAGTTEQFKLVNMKHYQHRSFSRLYFSRKFYAGKLNTFHISVVGFDTKGKEVKSVIIKDAGEKARVCIFAATAELTSPIKRNLVLDETVNKSSQEKVIYKKEVPNGIYTLGITCSMEQPLGSTLDIYVQGHLIINHIVPVAKTTYEIPVEVTDGNLQVELLPGEIHHKTRSVIGNIILEAIQLAKLDKSSWIPTVKKDSALKKPLVYGWKLRGKRAVLRDMAATLYRGPKVKADKEEILLNWDTAFIDKWGIGKVEFITDLPNGIYDIKLVVMTSRWGGTKGDVDITIEGEKKHYVLPVFDNVAYRSYIPKYITIKKKVEIKDGQLNIIAELPPEDKRRAFDACGICSLTIRKP